jgi:SNF2 family DNA or RNA helicase
MQNNLDELQSLIHFLQIKPYDDPKVWKEQITKPMKNGRGGTAIKRLQYFLKAVMKRRTKDILKKDGALNHGGKASKEGEQSGFKVTERRIEEIKATFSVEERKFYDRLEQRTERSLEEMEGGGKISYANALVLLLRLRQACNHPELVAGKLDKDKDALAVSNGAGKVSTKPKVSSKEVDDVADLLGGLTVESTNCEVCLLKMSKKEVANGAIRCSDCEDDVVRMRAQKKSRDMKGKRRADTTQPRNRTIKHRPRVIDSDDEEEGDSQGAWVVPEKQRNKGTPSKAGHTDDEDAESGGEWIEYEDMSVPDESDSGITKPAKHKQRRAIPLDTSDEDSTSEEDEEDEEEDDEEGFSSSDEADLSSLVLSTKTECLLKILHKETEKHKFIVFSQFTSMLDLIEPFLRRDGFNYTRYDGSMRNDQREASLNRLRNSPKCRILLCSLKCGSLGLNLTAASRVVILEPFWNPVRFLPFPSF